MVYGRVGATDYAASSDLLPVFDRMNDELWDEMTKGLGGPLGGSITAVPSRDQQVAPAPHRAAQGFPPQQVDFAAKQQLDDLTNRLLARERHGATGYGGVIQSAPRSYRLVISKAERRDYPPDGGGFNHALTVHPARVVTTGQTGADPVGARATGAVQAPVPTGGSPNRSSA